MSREPLSLDQQAEAARAELELAVHSGESACVELMLENYPELIQNEELVLELIYLEYVLREEAGQRTIPDEYQQRFPQFAARIAKLFEFEKLLDPGWQAPETLGESPGTLMTPAIDDALNHDHGLRDHRSRDHRSGDHGTRETLAQIGDYDCLSVIGRGGMGLVYLAVHRTLRRTAAIKVVSLLNGFDDKSTERFLNEARICGRLNHPQIVQIYDSGIHEGIPFFIMEYMPGGSLQDALQDGPLEPAVAAQVVRMLAQAVSFAHGLSIVHRDLKPGNVLITSARGEGGIQLRPESLRVDLKISDFGLAKCLTEPGTQTRTGTPVGTPAYMAPEQVGSASPVDARCDVYALGAMLYHLLVGKPPFQAATVIETLQLVQTQSPIAVRTLQPSVPRDLETICLKCLQKEPQQRYSSVDELSEDLQRFIERRPIKARPTSLLEQSWRWAKRKPMAALAMVSVLIAAVLTTALWLRAESYRQAADQASLASQEATQQTLVALRKLTSTVVLKKFAEQDQLSSQDRAYLQEIATLYEQLALLPLVGTDSHRIRGEGHYWSGVVYLRLADSKTAVEHFKAAIKILSSIEESAKSEELFLMINDSMEMMVEGLEIDNRIDEAIAATQARIDRCQDPPKYVSSDARANSQRSIVAGYCQLGHLYDLVGDVDHALANWRKAHALTEKCLLSTPQDFKLLSFQAEALRSMSSVETDPQLQLSLSSQAIEVARVLANGYPDVPNVNRQLAWSLFDRADLLKNANQLEEALVLTDEAIKIAQAMVDRQPLMDEYRGPLAVYLGLRCQLLNMLGRFPEARDGLMRSIELLRRNLETSPQAAMVHMQLARSWVQLVRAQYGCQATNDVIEQTRRSAEESLEELREVLQASGADLAKYNHLKRELDRLQ